MQRRSRRRPRRQHRQGADLHPPALSATGTTSPATSASHLFLVSVENRRVRDLTPNDPARRSALLARRRRLRLRLCARLEGTGLHRQPRSRAGHLHQRRHLHARPDQPRRQAGEGQHLARRRLQPRLLARRQSTSPGVPRHAPATKATSSGSSLYDRAAKTDQGPAAQLR